jgi:hypothetical protein
MKNNIYIAALLAISMAFLCACSGNSNESCSDTNLNCATGGTILACCTDTSCRYEHNGVSYPCDGVDCYDAAAEVAKACVGSAKVLSSDSRSVEELLLLEKSDNLLLEREIDNISNN